MALPRLSTTRLVLRPLAAADADVLWAIWREPDVRRYLFDDEPLPRERAAAIVGDTLAVADRGLGLWTVAERDGTVVGCVGLLPVTAVARYDPRLAGEVEVLAAFVPAVWGRGYARESLGAVLGYAFQSLRLGQVVGVADTPNEASHRMLRDLGFAPTGEHQGPRYRARSYVLTAAACGPRSRVMPS